MRGRKANRANEDYGIKTLTCQYEIKNYSRYTISKDMKHFIQNYVLHPILSKLNACTNMNFKATNIERVVQKVSKDGTSCLYLIEVFIYDKANFFEKKIMCKTPNFAIQSPNKQSINLMKNKVTASR